MRVRICDDWLWAIFTNHGTCFFYPFVAADKPIFTCDFHEGMQCVPFKFYNKYEIILVYDINVTGTVGSPDGARNSRRLVSQSKSSAVECLYDNAKSEIESRCG